MPTRPPFPRARLSACSTYVSKSESAADDLALADGDAAGAELSRQRLYLERAVGSLKGRVARAEGQRAHDQRAKLGENQALLDELNALRVANKELKARAHLLATQLELVEGRAKQRPPTAADGGGAGATLSRIAPASAPPRRPPPAAGGAGGSRLPPAGGLPAVPRTSSSSGGQLARGSAITGSRERTRVAEMLAQLDENNKELGAQRSEIRRLRDQVSALVAQPAALAE